MFTLRNIRLQYLFNSESNELQKSFLDLAKQTDEKSYKYEVMIAFWLAVELGKDEEARTMLEIDPMVGSLIINLRENGTVYEKHKRNVELRRQLNRYATRKPVDHDENDDEEAQRRKRLQLDEEPPARPREYEGMAVDAGEQADRISNPKFKQFQSTLAAQAQEQLPSVKSQDELDDEALERMQQVKTSSKIRGAADVEDLRRIMRSKVGAPFCTNVLRIALNLKEVSIASVLVHSYSVSLDERMLVRAIKTNQMQFIYCVWAFNKNYERVIKEDTEIISDDSDFEKDLEEEEDSDEEPEPADRSDKYRTYTFDMLFKLILQYCPDSYLPKIRAVAGFALFTSENFIMSLLINRQDAIAADNRHIKEYVHDLTAELMVFAIRNQNEHFLRFALFHSLLGAQFFAEDKVREELLAQLESKAKTVFVLNVLIFADFSRWPQLHLRRFIDCVDEMTGEPHEQNRIVLTYNPILCICLSCLHLTAIGDSISFFKHRGSTVSAALLDLGSAVIGDMADESIRPVFMDKDFMNRTVLHIITYNGYAPLMSGHSKVTVLLDQLWQGKLTYLCDGRLSDYSMLQFMVTDPIRKLPGQKIEFGKILGLQFRRNVEKESYAVQFKFRKSSIAIIFQKNFLSAIVIVIIFTYINIKYQSLFNLHQFKGLETEQKKEALTQNLKEFETYTMLGQITSFSCLTSVIGQFIFNSFSKYKVPFDKWAVLDFANALSNTICFGMFATLSADGILDPLTKEAYNWIQVFAVLVSWGRFISFFLVIQSISILIMTAIQMVIKAMTFIALTISYIIVMIPFFQILFQEDTIVYVDFIVTARTLFDSMLGNYGFNVTGADENFHAIIIIFHILISNIYLLNYLIAILSTVYEEMAELGDFAYKSSKYQYIERY